MKVPFAVVLFLSIWGVAIAEDQSPKPGPEVQRLGYYVGSWEGHGESKGGPFGPPGKLSSKFTCNWFSGAFAVVCRGEESGPTGSQEFLNIKSYDETTKSYTEYSISSLGGSEYAQGGSIVGTKMTYIRNVGAGENAATIRYTEEYLSPSLLAYKAEASVGGGPWRVIAEGNIRKVT